MDLGLSGRVYLLTGASRGLGFATAQCLVADGAKVVVSARTESSVEQAAAGLAGSGPGFGPGFGPGSGPGFGPGSGPDFRSGAALGDTPHPGESPIDTPAATGIAADLADPGTPDRLIEAAFATYGRLDGALISVGGPPLGTAAQVTDDQWRAAFESVFLGAVRMARSVVAHLDRGGSVGMVLSSSSRTPIPGLGISNGLRPGLAAVVKDMADEMGPRGVRVFGLLPHRILTDRNRELFAATGDPAAAQATAEAAIPLRRLGDPVEFGRVAAFLLSPAASYLTGLSVPVDGGALRTP